MSRTLRRSAILLAAAASVAMPAVFATAALAQGSDGDGPVTRDQIVLTGSLVVPEGETVENAVIFNGDALIEGTVSEALVVFNGRAEIAGSVGKDAVVFNGPVLVRSGAVIGGDLVSRQAPKIQDGATVRRNVEGIARRFDFPELGLEGRIAWWIGYSVSTLVLGLVLLRNSRGLDAASGRAIDRHMAAVFGFGALTFFLLPVVAGLLFITVVAIPLGLFLALALGLWYSIGYVVGSIALARLVVKGSTSRYLAFLAGWGALRLLALVPVLGGTAWVMTTIIGLGVLWVAARSTPEASAPVSSPPPEPAVA